MKKHPLHVIFSKEEIDPKKIDKETIVIVFDVLLATTTIATVLHFGATEVIPVLSEAEAWQVSKAFDPSTIMLTGEYGGKTIDGFMRPLPTYLKDLVADKTIILSTTNGTVAIRNVEKAKSIYAVSLVNVKAAAEKIAVSYPENKILLICAGGNKKRFAMEDFYGAGCFIDYFIRIDASRALTDAANTALLFYRGSKMEGAHVLKQSSTGKMMMKMGLEKDVLFASEKGIIPAVPRFENGKMKLIK